jgi:toxin ParE1/3/4
MANYRITRLAQSDLQSIWDYTVEQWSLSQAEKYIDGLFDCFDAIADGTTQVKAVDHIRQGYKKAVYGRHVVFFKFGNDQVTEIIRVLHSSMDIETRLADE